MFTVEDVNHWLSRFIVEFGKLNEVLPSKCLYCYKYSTYEACVSRETLLWMRRSTISLKSERRYVLKRNSCHQRLVFVLVNFIMHVQWMRGKNLCKNRYMFWLPPFRFRNAWIQLFFFEYLVRQLFIPLSYFEKTYSCWLFLKLMTDYVKNHPCKYICTIIMHAQCFPFLLDYRSEFVKQITIIRKRRNSCRHLKSMGFLQVNLYSIVAF